MRRPREACGYAVLMCLASILKMLDDLPKHLLQRPKLLIMDEQGRERERHRLRTLLERHVVHRQPIALAAATTTAAAVLVHAHVTVELIASLR